MYRCTNFDAYNSVALNTFSVFSSYHYLVLEPLFQLKWKPCIYHSIIKCLKWRFSFYPVLNPWHPRILSLLICLFYLLGLSIMFSRFTHQIVYTSALHSFLQLNIPLYGYFFIHSSVFHCAYLFEIQRF